MDRIDSLQLTPVREVTLGRITIRHIEVPSGAFLRSFAPAVPKPSSVALPSPHEISLEELRFEPFARPTLDDVELLSVAEFQQLHPDPGVLPRQWLEVRCRRESASRGLLLLQEDLAAILRGRTHVLRETHGELSRCVVGVRTGAVTWMHRPAEARRGFDLAWEAADSLVRVLGAETDLELGWQLSTSFAA